jgi:hypothetical protein
LRCTHLSCQALLENISSDEFDSDEEGKDKKAGKGRKKQKTQGLVKPVLFVLKTLIILSLHV